MDDGSSRTTHMSSDTASSPTNHYLSPYISISREIYTPIITSYEIER